MEKNFYQILQVDQNASPEIIEKAYKTLVKKYHPDLQSQEEKQNAEIMIKHINEAYNILSNKEKRQLYDQEIGKSNVSIEDYNKLYNENQKLQNEINNELNNINYYKNNIEQNVYNKNYYNNRNYNIKPKTSFEEKCLNIIALIITISILFILFKIPFIKNFLIRIISVN